MKSQHHTSLIVSALFRMMPFSLTPKRRLLQGFRLTPYQSGSRQRAALIAEACFNALHTRDLGYINPPASFETDGQRAWLVDRLLRERLGTFLDLTLLLASLWEQCGLFPLVLLPQGHAMATLSDTQVGCAGYRVDLGVRDPQKPGRYLLGIECDGATYHSAKTARDRDRLRQGVLENLGWTIERVWSTDWWINPAGCLAKLEAAIQNSVQAELSPMTDGSFKETLIAKVSPFR